MRASRRFNIALLLALALELISSGSIAEEDSNISAQIKSFLPQSCYLNGNFSQQKTINDLPDALHSEGAFLFSCDHGLIWQTETPIVETLVYKAKGKPLRISASGDSESLGGRLQKEIGNLLNNLIGADIDRLLSTFLVEINSDELVLQPKRKQFQKFISAIHLVKTGESIAITMLSPTENTAIAITDVVNRSELTEAQCESDESIAVSACEWLFK